MNTIFVGSFNVAAPMRLSHRSIGVKDSSKLPTSRTLYSLPLPAVIGIWVPTAVTVDIDSLSSFNKIEEPVVECENSWRIAFM